MPVPTAGNKNQYDCDGAEQDFQFTYPIFLTSDLEVWLRYNPTEAETKLTETTHYTVSATNNDYSSGCTVSTVATYSSDYSLTIKRIIAYIQPIDLTEAGKIPADILDQAHDRSTYQIQQVAELIERTILLPDATTYANLTLPEPVAEKYLAWKADLSGLKNVDVQISGALTVSAFIETLLDDADAAAAKTTLGLGSIKIGTTARNTGGDQVISGVGFNGKVMIFLCASDSGTEISFSVGVDDGTEHKCLYKHSDGKFETESTKSIKVMEDGSNFIQGYISAKSSDGFTITWGLTGAITARFIYLCLQ